MRVLLLAAALVTCVAFSATASAQVYGRIAGIATDSAGELLAGVIVAVPGFHPVVTDSDGRYTIEGLPAGIYRLEVESGHLENERTSYCYGFEFAEIIVSPGHTTRADLGVSGFHCDSILSLYEPPIFSLDPFSSVVHVPELRLTFRR